ncbi:YicC family protein [candidate division WOR-3 bacterium]|nr:YicC family protein [candidate division WOR-3 bacterium]
MPNSMTGFAHTENELKDGSTISVAIKSLNHRYLDVNLNAMQEISNMEPQITKLVQKYMKRGKIYVSISLKSQFYQNGPFSFDEEVAKSSMEKLEELRKILKIQEPVHLEHILKLNLAPPREEQILNEDIWNSVRETLDKTLEDLSLKRRQEGEILSLAILNFLGGIRDSLKRIENKAPTVKEEKEKKLKEILENLLEDFFASKTYLSEEDKKWFRNLIEARTLSEIAIFTDRITIKEETERLNIHLDNFRETIKKVSPVGKSLDFLVQEMQREANTISSKAQSADISMEVVRIKENLENIREQVQNIE